VTFVLSFLSVAILADAELDEGEKRNPIGSQNHGGYKSKHLASIVSQFVAINAVV
jgi:hypothetical protein